MGCLSIYWSVHLLICLSVYWYLSVCLSTDLSIYLLIRPSVRPSIYWSVCLSVSFFLIGLYHSLVLSNIQYISWALPRPTWNITTDRDRDEHLHSIRSNHSDGNQIPKRGGWKTGAISRRLKVEVQPHRSRIRLNLTLTLGEYRIHKITWLQIRGF